MTDIFGAVVPSIPVERLLERPVFTAGCLALIALLWYLVQLNRVLSCTPEAVLKLTPRRWTDEDLWQTYRRLEKDPITTESYAPRLPPRLHRRYIVTGGSGLVGGHIVLQLLARGQDPKCIRIVDFRPPHRPDMLSGQVTEVPFVQADISSPQSTQSAFSAPWHPSVRHLPLTVFHTAAVIVPSDRSPLFYGLCEAVNVRGTEHVLAASQRAGADVLVSTTSGSISIRPVGIWVSPWRLLFGGKEDPWPRDYWQLLDERDFWQPLRRRDEFFSNYPASKAVAERIVTDANCETLRTGCIRPANGVYGNPTDNTVGAPLGRGISPEWTINVVQSFVHAANVAVAHLQLEAILQTPSAWQRPQAGRPFTVTDPNPPITYGDLYRALAVLAATPFRAPHLQPVPMLLVAYLVEWYCVARARFPATLGAALPPIAGDVKHLKPPLWSITAHLPASNRDAARPVAEGGIGYEGVITTRDGMVQEVLEWNREHAGEAGAMKVYLTSVSFADEIQRLGAVAANVKA